MRYRLTKRADGDVSAIYAASASMFGLDQADRYQDGLRRAFEHLAENPRVVRERPELGRGVRAYSVESHVVFYRVEGKERILILRVLHGQQDWKRHLT